MTLKEQILAAWKSDVKLPESIKEIFKEKAYESIGKNPWNVSEGPEMRLDSEDNKFYYFFYFDSSRNPNQVTTANLIVGTKLL